LFNSSRDIYYYCRERLNLNTIRLLIMKLYITRFELAEDLRAIKVELFGESDSKSDSNSNDDCDLDFRYISDKDIENLIKDINNNDDDDYDDNEVDDNNINRARESYLLSLDNF
jgi:hypothetical protein